MPRELRDPSLAQLRAFRRLSEASSYATAAEATSWSRPALWQHVHRLEEYVNQQRSAAKRVHLTTGGQLTERGRELLAAANHVLDAVDNFRWLVEDFSRPRLTAALACYPAHAVIAASAADALRQSRPPVHVSMSTMNDELRRTGGRDLLRWLRDGVADVVIADSSVEGFIPDFATESEPLYEWHLVVVTGSAHPLHLESNIDLRQLQGERLLMSPRGHSSRDRMDALGKTPHIFFESESVDALYSLAEANWGVAVLPNDALPVRHAQRQRGIPWPAVVDGSEMIRGQYRAIYSAGGQPRSPSRRLALALAREMRTAGAAGT